MKTAAFKNIMVCLVVLATLSFASPACADDEGLPNPGITPDSPLYFFDGLLKGLGMFFTVGNEAKAMKALKYAEERLAEAQVMAGEQKVRETERAAESYNRYMERVRHRLEDPDVTTDLSGKVAVASVRYLDILENVIEQAPQEVEESLERAVTASADGQINALRVLARKQPDMAMDLLEDQMEKEIALVAARAASVNATGEIQVALDYAERLAELEDEMTAVAEENGTDITGVLERLAQSTSNRLQTLSRVYEKAPESSRAGIENAIENSVKKYERSLEKLQEMAAEDNTGVEALTQQETLEITRRLRASADDLAPELMVGIKERVKERAAEETRPWPASANRTRKNAERDR